MVQAVERDEEGRATKRRPYENASGEDERSRLAAHRARCSICKHPEREEIEREFVDWVSPREIAEDWKLPSYRAIYRHAHAVGLFEQRRKNWLRALDAIVERVREVPVTANAVVAAIRLSMKLEGETGGTGRQTRAPAFSLSLDGLPRTDAVTGVAPDDAGTLQCAPTNDEEGDGAAAGLRCARANAGQSGGSSLLAGRRDQTEKGSDSASEEGHRLKPVPPGRQDITSANGGGTGSDFVKAPADVATQGTKAVAREPDPRIVLGEDGRVAGIPWPWPKQKIAFARVGRRWRGRRDWMGG